MALVLGGLWIGPLLYFSAGDRYPTTRPDYESAGLLMAQELEPDDAVASFPLWGHKGPLGYYLIRGRGWDGYPPLLGADADRHAPSFFFDGVHEHLPFETSARNAHVGRLWVVVADERRFGRPKFDQRIGRRAVEWAQENMLADGVWEFSWLLLYRF